MRITSNHAMSATLAVLLCGAAGAQQTELASGEVRASHVLGATVKRLTGDSVGEVEDLIVSPDADVRLAVISVGGVLGVGGKTVAIPFNEFMIAPDGGTLFLTMSEEQLSAWPAFDLESIHTDSRSAADEPVSPLGQTTFEADDFASRGGDSTHENAALDEPESEQHAAATQQAEPAQPAAGVQLADSAPLSDTQQSQRADEEEQLLQAEQVAQTEQLAQAEQRVEEAHTATERDGTSSKSKAAKQPASALIGAQVVDPQDSVIGKVNDVVVTAEPPEVQVIVELGETPNEGSRFVAVPLPELTIQQHRTDQTGRVDRVESALTVAELDALPEYQYQNRF